MMEEVLKVPEYKRFMVFAIEQYYASGGLSDVKESFDSESEACAFLDGYYCDWGYVFDRVEGVTLHSKD